MAVTVHGQNDNFIPASAGEALYGRSDAADKWLVLIPGAGHNDLLGRRQVWDELASFLARF